MNLTGEQQEILKNCQQNIYVSAAPGSGKSTILSHICGELLKDSNNRVMLVTFTNKAARSIISKCSAHDRSRIIGGTFHSIAFRLLIGNGYDFQVCDEGKKRLIIRRLFNCKGDRERFEKIYKHISRLKSAWPFNPNDDQVQKYQAELARFNLVDFDDIIYQAIEKFQLDSFVIPPVTHTLVDELQDTSGPQLEMMKVQQAKLGCNMIGCADDDQSIYEWRGARPENVQDFVTTFKCKIMNMGFNFRSTTKIVEKSVKVITHNKKRIKKTIRPHRTEQGSVIISRLDNAFDETDYVIRKCVLNDDKSIAILYRNRGFKNHLEYELKRRRIKYVVNDSTDLSDRNAVRTLLCLLKISAGVFDLYDVQQGMKGLKSLGASTVAKIEKQLGDKKLSDFLEELKEKKGFKTSLAHVFAIQEEFTKLDGKTVDKLMEAVETHLIRSFDYPNDIKEFMHEIGKDYKVETRGIKQLADDFGLDSRSEHSDEDANIELSTVHGYKGMERQLVIIPWSQQFDELKPGTDEESERRLFYVAITRAMDDLVVTFSGYEPKFVTEMR